MTPKQLATEYLPLARSLAGKYFNKYGHLEFDDLLGYAVLGLMSAAERYQPDRGAAFATFAYPRIVGAMRDGVRKELRNGGRRHMEHLPERVPLEEWRLAEPESAPQRREQLRILRDAVEELPRRERFVIEGHGAGFTFEEMAGPLGVTKAWAHKLHERAVKKLRRKVA